MHARTSLRLVAVLTWGASALVWNGCSGDALSVPSNETGGDAGTNEGGLSGDASVTDDGPPQTTAEGGLPFACAATGAPIAPNPCPAVSGTAGHASFCFRPQWSGVTAVEVYLSTQAQAADWSAPFLALTNDGTGTFTGESAIANGTYPYVFRVHGSKDGLVKDGQYLLDQENPQFVPPPAGAPIQRSVSALTVPQTATPIFHVRGRVVFAGAPQACYSVDLEAGELLKPGGGVLSEHTTANFLESAADGSFDFPVAAGPFGIVVRFPFKLAAPDGGYPDPLGTPSVGMTRGNLQVTSGDVTLDPADIAYPETDYAKMSPTASDASVPVTFTFSLTPGSTSAQASVIGTNVAGNDPLYASGFTTTTSVTWDGGFNGAGGGVQPGTTYYWGAWQRSAPRADGGTVWSAESLLFPITFH